MRQRSLQNQKSLKKRKGIFCLFFFLLFYPFLSMGCMSSIPKKTEDGFLYKAQNIYQTVVDWKGNPEKNLIRADWQPEHYRALENIYVYGFPYFPFLFYNMGVVYTKEIPYFFASPVIAGTETQDQGDLWIVEHRKQYEEIFQYCWPSANSHANFINMDEWRKQEISKEKKVSTKKEF